MSDCYVMCGDSHKDETMNDKLDSYYIILMEWNYPTESGRDIHVDTFDTQKEALEKAREYCRIEIIHAKNHGPDEIRDSKYNWGPYSNVDGFLVTEDYDAIKEANGTIDGYMIVWATPSKIKYYFRVMVIERKIDKYFPQNGALFNRDGTFCANMCEVCRYADHLCEYSKMWLLPKKEKQ